MAGGYIWFCGMRFIRKRAHLAGYRLPRRRQFHALPRVLYSRRHAQLNRRLYRLSDAGIWPRNPAFRHIDAPLKAMPEQIFSRRRR